jgi:hypothetical protein
MEWSDVAFEDARLRQSGTFEMVVVVLKSDGSPMVFRGPEHQRWSRTTLPPPPRLTFMDESDAFVHVKSPGCFSEEGTTKLRVARFETTSDTLTLVTNTFLAQVHGSVGGDIERITHRRGVVRGAPVALCVVQQYDSPAIDWERTTRECLHGLEQRVWNMCVRSLESPVVATKDAVPYDDLGQTGEWISKGSLASRRGDFATPDDFALVRAALAFSDELNLRAASGADGDVRFASLRHVRGLTGKPSVEDAREVLSLIPPLSELEELPMKVSYHDGGCLVTAPSGVVLTSGSAEELFVLCKTVLREVENWTATDAGTAASSPTPNLAALGLFSRCKPSVMRNLEAPERSGWFSFLGARKE